MGQRNYSTAPVIYHFLILSIPFANLKYFGFLRLHQPKCEIFEIFVKRWPTLALKNSRYPNINAKLTNPNRVVTSDYDLWKFVLFNTASTYLRGYVCPYKQQYTQWASSLKIIQTEMTRYNSRFTTHHALLMLKNSLCISLPNQTKFRFRNIEFCC